MSLTPTQAFVIDRPRSGHVRDWPLAPGEVTLDVEACALCHREHGVWHGAIPRALPDVLGHEIVGRVVGAPVESGLKTGDRVAGMGDAGLALRTAVDAWKLVRIGEHLDASHAALVEPLVCAVNAVEQDDGDPAGSALVVGLGLLGCLVALTLVSAGRDVVVADSDIARRRIARRTGFAVAPDLGQVPIARYASLYECTGDPDALWDLSVGATEGCTLVLVGHQRGRSARSASDLLDAWHMRGLCIANAVPRTSRALKSCVTRAGDLVENGTIDLSMFSVRTGPLSSTGALLSSWPTGEVFRHVVVM